MKSLLNGPAQTLKRPPFFWLHIKKCGGGTIRRALAPHYVLAERLKRPVNFIQSPPEHWNDILNNFRIPLGEYQFRRALFARTFLYPDTWDTFPRFAFIRPPVERAVSMFFYLREPRGIERSFVQHLIEKGRTIPTNDHALFDLFLNLVAQSRESPTIFAPVNLHFTTHVAPVWDDVTDQNGTPILSHLFRLDTLSEVIRSLSEALNLAPALTAPVTSVNARSDRLRFTPSPEQIQQLEHLYPHDFDLYEDALTSFQMPQSAQY